MYAFCTADIDLHKENEPVHCCRKRGVIEFLHEYNSDLVMVRERHIAPGRLLSTVFHVGFLSAAKQPHEIQFDGHHDRTTCVNKPRVTEKSGVSVVDMNSIIWMCLHLAKGHTVILCV